MHRSARLAALSLLPVLLLALGAPGCGGSTTTPGTDAGTGGADTGADAGTGGADAGSDAGGAGADSGSDGGIDAAAAVDANSTPTDGGGTLATCGGRSGPCAGDEWCDYAPGGVPCGAADGTGVCRARPDACVPATEIVCGCDGVTYENACEAARAGADVQTSGGCSGAPTFGCGGAIRCATSVEYCQLTTGGADPGFTSYQCVPLPSRCTASGSTPPSCTFCFPSGPPGGTCDDGASGELTVTLLAP